MSRRQESIPYPHIWRRFTGKKTLPDGSLIQCRIQDATDDMYDEVIDFLLKYFITESPIPKLINMSGDPAAKEFLREFWKETLAEKISLVAIVDNENTELRGKLVGINLLHRALKNEPKPNVPIDKSSTLKIWFGFIDYISDKINPFEYYNVDEYLGARGLSVDPTFRGENIGLELLKGRLDIGKALGLKVSVTLFTNIASQKVAEKAGFKSVVEIIYEDYQVDGKVILSGIETRAGKLMSAII